MTKIKIKSNPYTKNIEYFVYEDVNGQWENIKQTDCENTELIHLSSERSFLPFKIREIVDTIIKEYYIPNQKVTLVFEGTKDEYDEIVIVCESEDVKDKIDLIYGESRLKNARYIKPEIKNIFDRVDGVIRNVMNDDRTIIHGLDKVSQALNDVIPICVFGNYSAGKSTFINALIGKEILPSGGDPVTSKIFEIHNSDQSDYANISFTYNGEKFAIAIEGNEFELHIGNPESPIINNIKKELLNIENRELYAMLRTILNYLNDYEKLNQDGELGSIVSLTVPYSQKSLIANPLNKFVIFDTPGSNSNSNQDHAKVLAEAMDGFSNGIPVWVTEYDAHDTKDNADLCDKILEIDSLDKRFTMIVFNKSDEADLPGNEFTKKQEENILSFRAIEKMYASGIFFVSSIMGLGAKTDGEFVDRFYRKTFRMQNPAFSDPEDIDYLMLYRYNIMPEQLKQNALMNSSENPDLIYANSGLYCIENEIEKFGSKYSAYNKCQMVYSFLKNVIAKTDKKIEKKLEESKKTLNTYNNQLDEKKKSLEDSIVELANNSAEDCEKDSKNEVDFYTKGQLKYSLEIEELEQIDSNYRSESYKQNEVSSKEEDVTVSKEKLVSHLKEHQQKLFNKDALETTKNMIADFKKDFIDLQQSKKEKDLKRKEADKQASEQVIERVISQYKNDLDNVQSKLSIFLNKYWQNNELQLKKELTELITGTDALNDTQRNEIANIIQSFDVNDFKDQANIVFSIERFLKNQIFGIKVVDDETLALKRLSKKYNDIISENIDEISKEMNDNCFNKFKFWKNRLLSEINKNLVNDNPELYKLSLNIEETNNKIKQLEDNKQLIQNSFKAIEDWMSWKIQEGD